MVWEASFFNRSVLYVPNREFFLLRMALLQVKFDGAFVLKEQYGANMLYMLVRRFWKNGVEFRADQGKLSLAWRWNDVHGL